MKKTEVIDQLNKAKFFLVVTEESVAFRGNIATIAALLATASEQDKKFRDAMIVAAQAYNDYQIQKN